MTTKTTSVSELNERRHQAVQLRLDGKTLATVSETVGLSTPTVVAAMKAYESGGWDAVNVKPRGRPRRAKDESPDQIEALNQSLITTAMASDQLWTTTTVRDWFEQEHSKAVSEQTAASYLQRWDLVAFNAHRTHRHSKQLAIRAWLDDVHAKFCAEAKRQTQTVLWIGCRKRDDGTVQLYAHSLRGRCVWQLLETIPDNETSQQFIEALSSQYPKGLAAVLLPSANFLVPLLANNPFIEAPQDFESEFASSANTSSQQNKKRTSTPRMNESTEPSRLTHLERLEAESIHIMREVVAEADNPVMLYSLGKDSSVMLHLARKAFYPGPVPFPLLHIDTGWKFKDMYTFRDKVAKAKDIELLTYTNSEGVDKGVNPFTHGSELHTDIMKTQGLKQALDKYDFDVAFGGARRDEEQSRAKERVFSFRNEHHQWQPKSQRPELWNLYNTRKRKGESIRVFPLSNWTELDIWLYIQQQDIPIVPLYYAAQRPIVERDDTLLMVDDDRFPLNSNEQVQQKLVRFRTLGCYPLTGAVISTASSTSDVIQEMLLSTTSERQGRMTDHDSAASMEKKKQEGYF